MKKLILSFLLIPAAIGLFAQKTVNDPNAEKRTVGSFHGLEVGTGIELVLTHGNSEEVAVSANKTEHRDKIVTEVKDGVLKIYYENKVKSINKINETKGLKAWVSYKTLDKLNANTGAEVQIEGTLQASSLDMKVNTGAEVNGKVDVAGTLSLDQNTGSKVNLTGKADKLDAEGSTGSRFNGEDLAVNNGDVRVSTGARVAVNAQKELQAKASTGGIVKYKGGASVKEVKSSTGGSISKI